MKKILLSILVLVGLMQQASVNGQTFSAAHDTVFATVNKVAPVYDYITNLTGSDLSIKWGVLTSNFPSDWLTAAAFGICDNTTCNSNGSDMQLWNDTTHVGGSFTSTYYGNSTHDSAAPFSLSLNLSEATTLGTYYVTVKLRDLGGSGFSKNVVFAITKTLVTVSTPQVPNTPSEILLYPNPASNEVNLVFDGNSDIRNVAVYNIIGKAMTVYKVSGSSANLNIESIPSGVYFVRLYNGLGHVVGTRKFTKQ